MGKPGNDRSPAAVRDPAASVLTLHTAALPKQHGPASTEAQVLQASCASAHEGLSFPSIMLAMQACAGSSHSCPTCMARAYDSKDPAAAGRDTCGPNAEMQHHRSACCSHHVHPKDLGAEAHVQCSLHKGLRQLTLLLKQ